MKTLLPLFAVLSLLAPLSAFAEDAPPAAAPDDHLLYISISPIHLAIPFVELTGEYRLDRKFGVAAIAGAGKSGSVIAYDFGAQGIWYPIGHFDHGMQLGAEALYTGGGASTVGAGQTISSSAGLFAIGPFIGYKLATNIGFSFNIQAGAEYVTGGGSASSTDGASASVKTSGFIPLVNLQVGWSF